MTTIMDAFRFGIMKREACSPNFWRDVAAEFLATFLLMSVQAALPLSWGRENMGTVIQVALGMGFIVATMAWALGDFGGGHINPAVSMAMVVRGSITVFRGVLYIIAQSVGAIAGAGFMYAVTPSDKRETLAATNLGPGVEAWQGFLVEAWVTFILVLTIMGSTNASRKGTVYMPTILIGFAVALGVMSAFNHTGASMNPARSFGSAVVMNLWANHWVYWIGPMTGGVLAAFIYGYVLDRVTADNSRKSDTQDASYVNHGAGITE